MARKRLLSAERRRLIEDSTRQANWKRWGPYLAERQWGTVREDYSATGECWDYFPHDHARSRAYRWGEDGLLGWCDRQCRICIAVALWNERDAILKERLFGLTNSEGNHGEDVKESYFYLDSTPTHSYAASLYKYPQAAFPYEQLVQANRNRPRALGEFELIDAGVFDHDRYFDVLAEYAKAHPDETLLRITVTNRGPQRSPIHILPTVWFRNTWSWGCAYDGCWVKPVARQVTPHSVELRHATLPPMTATFSAGLGGVEPKLIFTENETNMARVFGQAPGRHPAKDGFHELVIRGNDDAVSHEQRGTKVAAWRRVELDAGQSVELRLRLQPADARSPATDGDVAAGFDQVFAERIIEADEFYAGLLRGSASAEERRVARQAYAGLFHTKQFYHLSVHEWLEGDPDQPPPPPQRKRGRNSDWPHLFNRDVIMVPDKWEYPWYAAWDLAFHTVAVARADPFLAKEQLILLLREWYMHPNGQIPAYEFAFGDVNPPVHAWACWRVYKMTGPRGRRDLVFLARAFHKLMINFTWWVNRKDLDGRNIFAGGFLGMDNVGVFDRSRPLPTGGRLAQADGTAWMAFFCATMLSIALELASHDPAYEDVATKFFEHFVAIADAINRFGGEGLWDERDGFYYDQLQVNGDVLPLRVRSMVGLVPLLAVEVLEEDIIERLPNFKRRMHWFLENRRDLHHMISCMTTESAGRPGHRHMLLAIPTREHLLSALRYAFDEQELLSPYGVRSLSRHHLENPYRLHRDGAEYTIEYQPGESKSGLFGGNSNWRGPIWFPLNFLFIEALERYDHFYGDTLHVEYPTGSGRQISLRQAARDIESRLIRLFLPDQTGRRPCHGDHPLFASNPGWRDLVLFHEYFHGDTGAGLGAEHQTGWTALVARMISKRARRRVARSMQAGGHASRE